MYQVNIYLETSLPGLRRSAGWYGYLLEYISGTGELHTRYDFRKKLDVTPNMLILTAFCAALDRLGKDSELTVYTDSLYLRENYSRWLQSWKENGWRTARGEEVKNKELWQQVDELTARHVVRFASQYHHGYKNWMTSEIQRKKYKEDA